MTIFPFAVFDRLDTGTTVTTADGATLTVFADLGGPMIVATDTNGTKIALSRGTFTAA